MRQNTVKAVRVRPPLTYINWNIDAPPRITLSNQLPQDVQPQNTLVFRPGAQPYHLRVSNIYAKCIRLLPLHYIILHYITLHYITITGRVSSFHDSAEGDGPPLLQQKPSTAAGIHWWPPLTKMAEFVYVTSNNSLLHPVCSIIIFLHTKELSILTKTPDRAYISSKGLS